MKIFSLRDFNIIVEPEVLLVPEFKTLWDRDKSKSKNKVYDELKYIYFVYDSASPYSNMPKEARETTVKMDVMKDKKYKPDEQVNSAIKKFLDLSETSSQRLLISVKNKIDEIAISLDETPYTDDNSAEQIKAIDSTGKLIERLQYLEEVVNKEKVKGEHRRGNRGTRLFENRDSMSNFTND